MTDIFDVEARGVRVGDDPFGAGIVTSVVCVGGSVRIEWGGTGATYWPEEIVTVRRDA